MNYEETVAAIREHSRNRFALGDALLEQAPMGDDGAHNGSTSILERMAEDTDVELRTLMAWRQVAHRVPPNIRMLGASWTAYREASDEPDPIERVRLLDILSTPNPKTRHGRWTVRDVRVLRGKPPEIPTIHPATPEQVRDYKIKEATRLLADPDVQAVAENPATPLGQAITETVTRAHARGQREAQQRHDHDPVIQEARNYSALEQLGYDLNAGAQRVRDDLVQIKDVPERDVLSYALLRQGCEQWLEVGESVATLLRTGRTDHYSLLKAE